MQKFYISIVFCVFVIAVNAQVDLAYPTPKFWFKADSINENLFLWPDQSGNNFHVNYPASFVFSKELMNFQPCISVDMLQTPLFVDYRPGQSSEVSVFAVYKTYEDSTASGIWNIQLDSVSKIAMSSQFIKDLKKVNMFDSITHENSVVNLFRYKWTKQNIDSLVSGFMFLGNDSLLFNGRFAELMYFDSTLSMKDITKIHTYLAIKYGIGIHGMNYMNSDDQIIWNYIDNKDYSKEVAGIGKDSSLLIDQKQSCASGGESVLTISAGQLMNENSENSYHINEYDFLIWGDNGNNLIDFFSDSISEEFIQSVSQRKWKMVRYGSTAHQINTNVKVHVPEVDDSLVVFLLINESTDFRFPFNGTQIIHPDSIDNHGNYFFRNIIWDNDLSGSDAFSFQLDSAWLWIERHQDFSNFSETNSQTGFNKIQNLNVYPNPTNGYYTVDISLSNISDLRLTIYDENSKLINSKLFSSSSSYTFTGFVNGKGTFMLVFDTPDERRNIKLIVQ